jgi:hypothetical protein
MNHMGIRALFCKDFGAFLRAEKRWKLMAKRYDFNRSQKVDGRIESAVREDAILSSPVVRRTGKGIHLPHSADGFPSLRFRSGRE